MSDEQRPMRVYGAAAMADLLGDLVVYRNLRPIDQRLPSIADLAPALALASDRPPRKGSHEYARLVAAMLNAARQLDAPDSTIRRLVLIGDTRQSDGGAFTSLCAATGWDGRAFICQETPDSAPRCTHEGPITYANRWGALHDFGDALDSTGFAVDAATVIALDLDKTLIGARGRNDRQIDAARLRALQSSVASVLGASFDPALFADTYRAIDQAHFHPLTGDNQDYVAYICVMILGGVLEIAALHDRFDGGQLPDFAAFLALAGTRSAASPGLATFHATIAERVAAGDPTPFKAFRRREYQETIARMDDSPTAAPAEQLLAEQLVLTGEVWEAARAWQARGALLFGLSDKPDEAALPDEQLAARGALPLHRVRTQIVGS